MEYFVRTSHIIAGMIYLTLFLACIGSVLAMILLPTYKIENAVAVFFAAIGYAIFFLIVFSCLHYVVLKRFHPWAEFPDKENEKTD